MDQIDGMKTFVAVVESGSFSAAGKRLDISNKLVSKYIASLESRLGTSVIHRTTRSMSLTQEGRTYLEGCRRVLSEVEALASAMDQSGELKGKLRIAAPLTFGETTLAKIAMMFMEAHPAVVIEFHLSDDYVDIAQGGYDLAIRIGTLRDSSLKSRKLGETHLLVVAAPSYIDKHGAPKHPEELSTHICIRDSNNPDPNRWPFLVDGKIVHVPIAGPFIANSPPACLVPVYAGKGILICPDVFLKDDLQSGRLVHLLPGFHSRTINIQALRLPSENQNPKVKAFVEFMRQNLSS